MTLYTYAGVRHRSGKGTSCYDVQRIHDERARKEFRERHIAHHRHLQALHLLSTGEYTVIA